MSVTTTTTAMYTRTQAADASILLAMRADGHPDAEAFAANSGLLDLDTAELEALAALFDVLPPAAPRDETAGWQSALDAGDLSLAEVTALVVAKVKRDGEVAQRRAHGDQPMVTVYR